MTNTRLIFTNLREIAEQCADQKVFILTAVRALEVEFARLESENAHMRRVLPNLLRAAVE